MGNYTNIKATIDANIKANNNEEITGPVLNSTLTQMAQSIGSDASTSYIKGIFDRRSDFSAYNHVRIYDITPSERLDVPYKIGLRYVGVSGNYVMLAITQDCEDYGTPYYAKLLARYYVPLSSVAGLTGIQTIVATREGAHTVDYTIVINIDDLKNIPGGNNDAIFFDIAYMNSKIPSLADLYTPFLIERSIPGIRELTSYKHAALLESIFSITLGVPQSIKDHRLTLVTLYWNAIYKRLYFALWDETTNQDDAYGFAAFDNLPSYGVQRVVMTDYYNGVPGTYYFDVTIDWGKFSAAASYENDVQNGIVLYANNSQVSLPGVTMGYDTPLEDVVEGATILKGNFTLSTAISLGENQHLIGNGCVVRCSAGGKIIMAKGATLESIKFVGSWTPTRQPGTGNPYTQYGFIPLISQQDLSSGNSDAIWGNGKNESDGLIQIPATGAYNTTVKGCIFEGFNRCAITSYSERHQSSNNPLITGNYFADCWLGIAVMGEFQRVHANQFYRCVIGLYLNGGNCDEGQDIYKCCDCGVYFPAGNGAHGEMTANHICHCGIAGVYIKELSTDLGHTIIAGHYADAPFIGERVSNLLISGCRLDTYFDYSLGVRNSIICSNVRDAYLYGHALYNVPSDTQIVMNRGMGATTDAVANNEN